MKLWGLTDHSPAHSRVTHCLARGQPASAPSFYFRSPCFQARRRNYCRNFELFIDLASEKFVRAVLAQTLLFAV
jgi:hypothetical protein